MFEKEGIKYAIEETVGTECLSMPIEDFHFIDLSEPQQEKAQCFKDGAEFGYNKAKVEDSYRESLCNSELNLASVTEQLEELEKANEWHYVKDGDLPKDGVRVLSEKGHLVIYKGDCFCWFEYSPNADNIKLRKWEEPVAWKEIKLPELPKE